MPSPMASSELPVVDLGLILNVPRPRPAITNHRAIANEDAARMLALPTETRASLYEPKPPPVDCYFFGEQKIVACFPGNRTLKNFTRTLMLPHLQHERLAGGEDDTEIAKEVVRVWSQVRKGKFFDYNPAKRSWNLVEQTEKVEPKLLEQISEWEKEWAQELSEQDEGSNRSAHTITEASPTSGKPIQESTNDVSAQSFRSNDDTVSRLNESQLESHQKQQPHPYLDMIQAKRTKSNSSTPKPSESNDIAGDTSTRLS